RGGYQHLHAKDYEGATSALDPGGTSASQIGDYTLYYRAESEAAGGRPREAIRDYKDLASRFPDSLMVHESIIEAARASIAAGDPAAAMKLLSRFAQQSDPDALLVTAQACEAAGNNPQAV